MLFYSCCDYPTIKTFSGCLNLKGSLKRLIPALSCFRLPQYIVWALMPTRCKVNQQLAHRQFADILPTIKPC